MAAPGEGGREEAWRRGKSNRQLLLEVVQGVVACKVGVQVYASTWLYCTVLYYRAVPRSRALTCH